MKPLAFVRRALHAVVSPSERRLMQLARASLLILAPELGAQPARPPIRSFFGDVAIVLRPASDGTIGIGVAGAARTLTLTVRATDARRWTDSATKLLVPPPRRARRARVPNDSVQRVRVVLEEPGVGTGALVLSRIDSAGVRQFLLFADDAELKPVRQPLETEEARTFVRQLRRAAMPPPKPKAKANAEPTSRRP